MTVIFVFSFSLIAFIILSMTWRPFLRYYVHLYYFTTYFGTLLFIWWEKHSLFCVCNLSNNSIEPLHWFLISNFLDGGNVALVRFYLLPVLHMYLMLLQYPILFHAPLYS